MSATEAANSRCGRLRIMLIVAEGTPTPVRMPLAPRTISTRSYRAVSNSWLVLLLYEGRPSIWKSVIWKPRA
ncbi:hypothetical protein D3C87_1969390 [compost metagenome]